MPGLFLYTEVKLKANKNDILIWCGARKVLGEVADLASRMEEKEYDRLRLALIHELTVNVPNGKLTELWGQATDSIVIGVRRYGLERIGLLPNKPQNEKE